MRFLYCNLVPSGLCGEKCSFCFLLKPTAMFEAAYFEHEQHEPNIPPKTNNLTIKQSNNSMKHFFNFLSISDPAGSDTQYLIQRLRKALPPREGFFCRYVPGGVQAWCRSENGREACQEEHGDEGRGSLRKYRSFRRFTLRVQATSCRHASGSCSVTIPIPASSG
jgi:hypothetical protein